MSTTFTFATPDGPREIEIARLVIAGWTARDRAAVDHHIAELAALGVPPPSDRAAVLPGRRRTC